VKENNAAEPSRCQSATNFVWNRLSSRITREKDDKLEKPAHL